MKTKITSLITAGILGAALASQAAIITTSTTAPTSGEYLSDANSTDEGSFYWTRGSGRVGGQSFTHTTTGGEDWNLNSITFLGTVADMNSVTESTSALFLRVYEGNGFSGTQLGADIAFSTLTFDSTGYITMELTGAETAAVGLLTSGDQYTVIFTGGVTTADGFRLARSDNGGDHSGGVAWQQDGATTADYVFFVTAVPEPSSFALLGGLLALGHVMVRRRR